LIKYMTVIDKDKNKIQLQILSEKLALCTCCNPTFIMETPWKRKFTRCSFCLTEYPEAQEAKND